jgi:beta-hydroxylase
MQYIKSEVEFPFLTVLKERHATIKEELIAYLSDPEIAKITKSAAFSHFAAGNVISERAEESTGKWKTIGFYTHFVDPIEFLRQYNIDFDSVPLHQWNQYDQYCKANHFQRIRPVIDSLMASEQHGVISVFFSCFAPGMKLALHVNNDPYMYRSHLGVIVPEGEVAFKVCDEVVKWREGSVLAFDPIHPHTAWNLTDQPRIVLIVDFFKPELDRQRAMAMEREQFHKMMAVSPATLGMSGGYTALPRELVERYAVAGIG